MLYIPLERANKGIQVLLNLPSAAHQGRHGKEGQEATDLGVVIYLLRAFLGGVYCLFGLLRNCFSIWSSTSVLGVSQNERYLCPRASRISLHPFPGQQGSIKHILSVRALLHNSPKLFEVQPPLKSPGFSPDLLPEAL